MKPFLIPNTLLLLLLSMAGRAQTQPGGIAPDAKRIDFDVNMPFHDGYAVLSKGGQYAVINMAGEFTVPYGKYTFVEGFAYAMCPVQRDGKRGFIDEAGKEVIPCKYLSVHPFTRHGYALATRSLPRSETVLVDRSGKETVIDMAIAPPAEAAGSVYLSSRGIHDKFGKLVVPLSLKNFHQFSEGLAAAAKPDEFGTIKWGYIDEKGNTVIPFQFSREPGDFSNGLAFVSPADNVSDFSYGYIDKKGSLKIKMPRGIARATSENSSNVPKPAAFNASGYAISGVMFNGKQCLVDTEGNLVTLPQLADGEKAFDPNGIQIKSLTADDVLFQTKSGMMIMTLAGMVLVPPIFSELDHFDPASGLAPATLLKKTGAAIPTRGYINSEGVFVIIQKEKSQW